jgi:hypothetical protein
VLPVTEAGPTTSMPVLPFEYEKLPLTSPPLTLT